MINYLKSEHYRLLRKKSIYVTSFIGLFLIVAAAALLYYMTKIEAIFPYATSIFFYSNIVSSWFIILVIALIFNSALTGKDLAVIKQSISYGISRNTMFWSKLILTLSYFLILCVIGIVVTIALGESLLETENGSVENFLTACFNMLPIILSGFFIIHSLRMLNVRDIYVISLLLLIFGFSGNLLRAVFRPIPGLNELYKYAPSMQLNENFTNFLYQSAQLEIEYWITGIILSAVFLRIGVRAFSKKSIN